MKKTTLTVLGLCMLAGQSFAADLPKDAPPGEAPNASMGHHEHFKGDITRDQFVKRSGERFDKMDTNHDGKLTEDERKAAFEKFKAKRDEWRSKHPQDAGHGHEEGNE